MACLKEFGTHPSRSDRLSSSKIQGPTESKTSLNILAGMMSRGQFESLRVWTVFSKSNSEMGSKSPKTAEHKGIMLGSSTAQTVEERMEDTLSLKNVQNFSQRKAHGRTPVCSVGCTILFNTLKRTFGLLQLLETRLDI